MFSLFHYNIGGGTPRGLRKCTGDLINPPVWEMRIVNDCFEGENATEQLDLLAEVRLDIQ